jgi:hypothetical protein
MDELLRWASAGTGLLSAYYWIKSAQVHIPDIQFLTTGLVKLDEDFRNLAQAIETQAKRNRAAAIFAAATLFLQIGSEFLANSPG